MALGGMLQSPMPCEFRGDRFSPRDRMEISRRRVVDGGEADDWELLV